MKRITMGFMLAAALALPLSLLSAPSASAGVRVGVAVNFGPPPLPWYSQPMCPGYGYYWTPGYWGWGRYGYFWVPGAWVWPPMIGFLWTPGYWGWRGGYYRWHPGYWGRHVGFYGGIAYGHGYPGRGYHGGHWRHHHFYYNRAVTNVNKSRIHFTYNKPVAAPHKEHRVSYNGGKGGIALRPTAEQQVRARERHIGLTAAQTKHRGLSLRDPAMRFANNHGKPVVAGQRKPPAGIVSRPRQKPIRHEPAMRPAKPAGRPMTPVAAPQDRPRFAHPAGHPNPPVRRPVHPVRAPDRPARGPVHRPSAPSRADSPAPTRVKPMRAPRIEHHAAPPHRERSHRQRDDHGPPL